MWWWSWRLQTKPSLKLIRLWISVTHWSSILGGWSLKSQISSRRSDRWLDGGGFGAGTLLLHSCSTVPQLHCCFHLELSALPALAPFCSACQRIALQAIMDKQCLCVCNSAPFCNRCSQANCYSSKVKSCCLLCILALYPCTAPLHCAVALYPYTVSLPVIVLLHYIFVLSCDSV